MLRKYWDHSVLLRFLPYSSTQTPPHAWRPRESKPEKEFRERLPPHGPQVFLDLEPLKEGSETIKIFPGLLANPHSP